MGFQSHVILLSTSPATCSGHTCHRRAFQPIKNCFYGHDAQDGKSTGACAAGIVLCATEVSMEQRARRRNSLLGTGARREYGIL